ncbi:unnamed protein product, partial [Staurois parvus]
THVTYCHAHWIRVILSLILFKQKLQTCLYLPAVCSGFAQSSLDPALPGSHAGPPSCWVTPQQAGCYGGTRCSVCSFTHGAVAWPRPLSSHWLTGCD